LRHDSRRDAGKAARWPLLLLLAGAGIYLYLNLFGSHHTPFLLAGDQVYFWMDAQRMLDGERIYRDFLQFTPPGTDLLYFALFKLFGLHTAVANAAVLALGVAFCWLCFSIASEIMERRSALVATALFLVLIYGQALNGTHHWFSVLAIMGAVRAAMAKITAGRIAVAGVLLGVASFFNQTHGTAGLVAFAIFLLWRHSRTKQSSLHLLRDQALLLSVSMAALLLLNAHSIAAIGLRHLWYFQVTYPETYIAPLSQGQLLGLPGPLSWRTLPRLSPYLAVYLLLPIVYVGTLWQCWRQRNNPLFAWDRVALLSTVGLFLLMEVALSLNWLRLYAVSIPGIILLIWTFERLPKIRHYTTVLVWIAVICLAVRQTVSRHVKQPLRIQLPGGAITTTPEKYEKLHWLALHTRPGEPFFDAGSPGLYLPLHLRNPLYLDTLSPADATRPQQIEQLIEQIKRTPVQFIFWTPHLDSGCGPARRCEDRLTPFRDYLHSHYARVQVFSDGETAWQRVGKAEEY